MDWRWLEPKIGPNILRCPQMTGHGAKFGRKKEEAIAALLTQRNTEEAARAVGVAHKTLLRWLQIPEFKPRTGKRAVQLFPNQSPGCSSLRARRSQHY